MPDKNWQFELEEYIKQGEPDRAEKSEAWQTAIGLQAVDGLNTSEYLLDTAKAPGGPLELCVYEKNTAALRFYRRHGFLPKLRRTDPATGEATKPKKRISFRQE